MNLSSNRNKNGESFTRWLGRARGYEQAQNVLKHILVWEFLKSAMTFNLNSQFIHRLMEKKCL